MRSIFYVFIYLLQTSGWELNLMIPRHLWNKQTNQKCLSDSKVKLLDKNYSSQMVWVSLAAGCSCINACGRVILVMLNSGVTCNTNFKTCCFMMSPRSRRPPHGPDSGSGAALHRHRLDGGQLLANGSSSLSKVSEIMNVLLLVYEICRYIP